MPDMSQIPLEVEEREPEGRTVMGDLIEEFAKHYVDVLVAAGDDAVALALLEREVIAAGQIFGEQCGLDMTAWMERVMGPNIDFIEIDGPQTGP